MERNKTENGRRFNKCLTQLKVRYFLNEGKKSWKNCTIFNISRNGVCMRFHLSNEIDIGSTVHLEIAVPMEPEPIKVKGKLKWVKEVENDFIGNMELAEKMDDVKWAKLG